MKKIFAILALGLSLSTTACADDDIISQNISDLPVEAQSLIKKDFTNHKISYIKIDKDFISKSFEVQFTNGDEISFDKKGAWTEIECDKTSVPDKFIPAVIKEKVNQMFAGKKIRRIEKDKKGYEVELSDGKELSFDKKMKLREIDD
ncbi:MAG: PepSY-like domain-containing protein [Bacteroidaceae bacterium]|nr:PepSY-like domain-containing protein [Bacteroidaceae bacterium]